MKRLFSVPEVAERFGVTNQTVRNWIASGRLAAVQPGRRGRYRIPPEALRAFEKDAASDRHHREAPAGLLRSVDPGTSVGEQPTTATATTQEAGDELARIVRAIVASVHPDAVILFGSRARGDFRPDSDFDLALVAPDGTERRRCAMKAYEGIAAVRGRSIGVDVVVLTPRTIAAERDLPGSIARAVIRDGVQVYGSAPLA
jgi:excisionase family DNA binding protein